MFIKKVDEILAHVLEKDKKLYDHLERTSLFSFALSKSLSLSPKEMELAYFAGLLHDVGKIHLDNHKNENHFLCGSVILKFIDGFENLSNIIHELSDKDNELSILAQIVLIASDYDDMRHLSNLTHEKSLILMKEKFNVELINSFAEIIEKEDLI